MKTLINKIDLTLYGSGCTFDVPIGSKLEYIDTKTSVMHYYEMFTYVISCNLIDENEKKHPVKIRCSKYMGSTKYKVDCVKDNIHEQKKYYWDEVFDVEFPE